MSPVAVAAGAKPEAIRRPYVYGCPVCNKKYGAPVGSEATSSTSIRHSTATVSKVMKYLNVLNCVNSVMNLPSGSQLK